MNERWNSVPQRPPWRNMMLLIGLMLVGMSVGNLIALALIMLLSYGTLNMEQITDMLQNPANHPHAWWYLMLLQSVTHVCSFLVPSLVYWKWSEQHRIEDFVKRPWPPIQILGLTLVLMLVFMPFNSWIIEWNNNLHLPNSIKPIEQWMQRKENDLSIITRFITSFDTWPQLIVAIVVIALIPAIGEEVLFRGIIQRKIFYKIANMPVAIWISAALFSAIHLQFYGFVPRMLLGVIFGYLYIWSRNLWTPIFAHFINNATTVVILFLNHKKMFGFDSEQNQSSVPWTVGLASLVLTIAILYYLKSKAEPLELSYHDSK